jgi:hypothetical protein
MAPAPLPSGGEGVALGLFASDPLYDYGPMVSEIAEMGAQQLLIAVPWTLPSAESGALQSGLPPQALPQVLRQAREADLAVTVMPIVVLQDRSDGAWRGTLHPRDLDLFWQNYDALLRSLAIDSARGGALRLIVGSELNSLEEDPSWPGRIQQVRASFPGQLSYSANWDRYTKVPFWSDLDQISVSAYFPVQSPETWGQERGYLHHFAAQQDRPLVVSEYGFPALSTAAERPWDETTGADYDPALQAELLEQALRALQANPPQAHFLWNWFGTCSPSEASFTPRARPAAQVLRQAFEHPSRRDTQ